MAQSARLRQASVALKSAIHEYKSLDKLAKEAGSDQKAQRSIDHLTKELYRGNTDAGLGTKHLDGASGVRYMRGQNGGRLYFIERDSGYVIVGKSSKKNEQQVIDQLRKHYK